MPSSTVPANKYERPLIRGVWKSKNSHSNAGMLVIQQTEPAQLPANCRPAISKQPKYSRLRIGRASSVRIGYFAWIWLQKVLI